MAKNLHMNKVRNMRQFSASCITTFLFSISFNAQAVLVDDMIAEYAQESGKTFSAEKGKTLWNETHSSKKDGKLRSCNSCHTKDLTASGKHKKTGKKIDPLAPSVNNERLTDRKKINKWFKRNCKWTYGRKCTAEEKGHFLTYIKSQ